MKRKAILIEAARVKGQRHLPGAEADVRHFVSYLTSIAGGAWDQSEIIALTKPSSSSLLAEVRHAEATSDYLFLTFSGHGYMKPVPMHLPIPPTEKELTMLCLNDKEDVSLSIIAPNIKNFLIVDSCREIEKVVAAKMEEGYRSFAENMRRDKARRLFDAAVESAGPGQIVAYSCGINQTADEDPNRGGYFSAAMMESGYLLASSGYDRAISTAEVFDMAYKSVCKVAPQQNPQYRPGRRQVHFPFAVRA